MIRSSVIQRRKTKQIMVGNVAVGGEAPISVQSMTNTDTCDVESTVQQIHAIAKAGADIVRVSIPNDSAAEAFKEIRARSSIPVVVDIHFDYRLALKTADYGADCLRINPGNIGSAERVREVVASAKDHGIPIRIGVNGGSLEKDILEQYGEPTPEALVESALRHIDILEKLNFDNFKVSVKASDVFLAYDSYKLLASKIEQPLHLGITEAGGVRRGTISSAMGLSWLLREGIGDTLRVSLAADPVEEVKVGFDLLKVLKLRNRGVNFIACPTCSRRGVDVIALVDELEKRLADVQESFDVAIMGCVVNGPGEASRATLGICGAKNDAIYYENGSVAGRLSKDGLVDALEEKIRGMALKLRK